MIPVAKPNLVGNEEKYVLDCIKKNWVSSGGDYVKIFESKFAEFCGTKYASSSSNGTTALHLALLSLGICEGDEVIVPNLTFASTANVVKYCGAKEILVDVDKNTFNISIEEIEKSITSKTKAIIVVHIYGFPCDMEKIMFIAKRYNLFVIEDAAEAHGAIVSGQKVGSVGDIGCFSFFGNKLITTGEGGMCVTNNLELLNKINVLKNHGMEKPGEYIHNIVGYNYRLTNMQAALGVAQLERIDEFIEKRDLIAKTYIENLSTIEEISFQEAYPSGKQVYWMFSIILDSNSKISIDVLVEILKNYGIDTRKMFHPLNNMLPYRNSKKFPNSEYIFNNSLILPTFYDLSLDDVRNICEVIKNAFKKN